MQKEKTEGCSVENKLDSILFIPAILSRIICLLQSIYFSRTITSFCCFAADYRYTFVFHFLC